MPGDILTTGSPAGVGYARNPKIFGARRCGDGDGHGHRHLVEPGPRRRRTLNDVARGIYVFSATMSMRADMP